MPEASNRTVTVIIPTLALRERATHIRRAIDSVVDQKDVHALALVIVNGPNADPALVRELRRRPGVRLKSLESPNLPLALGAGRRLVESPWFAELDDDDMLLPHALASRLEMLAGSNLDAVVSNGIISGDGKSSRAIEYVEGVAANPLSALDSQAWLCPGAALFRSATVQVELFESMPQYLEWTYLAIRLAQTHKLGFLQEPTFVHYTDSPERTWTSDACTLGLPDAFQQLMSLDLPLNLRGLLARRMTSACNRAADLQLSAGRLAEAWSWHLRCLDGDDGWRYLPFTRKLLFACAQALWASVR